MKKMPWIVILGADGSGKSTVIDGLTSELLKKEVGVDYHHWRPVLRGKKGGDAGPVVDPHAEPVRSMGASWLRILILLGIWRISFATGLARVRKQGKFIVFDRYYGDLLVDPLRYRYGGGSLFASIIFKLMPNPDLVILLDGEAEVFFARKPEVELRELKKIIARYREHLKKIGNGLCVDATQPIATVIAQVNGAVNTLLR